MDELKKKKINSVIHGRIHSVKVPHPNIHKYTHFQLVVALHSSNIFSMHVLLKVQLSTPWFNRALGTTRPGEQKLVCATFRHSAINDTLCHTTGDISKLLQKTGNKKRSMITMYFSHTINLIIMTSVAKLEEESNFLFCAKRAKVM